MDPYEEQPLTKNMVLAYLKGDMDRREILAFERRLQSSPEDAELVDLIRMEMEEFGDAPAEVEAKWDAFDAALDQLGQPAEPETAQQTEAETPTVDLRPAPEKPPTRWWLRVAAVLILLAIPLYFVLRGRFGTAA